LSKKIDLKTSLPHSRQELGIYYMIKVNENLKSILANQYSYIEK